MKDKFVIIFVTCASNNEAQKIAAALLKKRLVACGNIVGGVRSKFWWKGKIDSTKETLLILKAKSANFKAVEKKVKRIHSYDVPEIIAIPIVAGSSDYLNWIKDNIR
jgi:periplasmic divalent cation tolerance protein